MSKEIKKIGKDESARIQTASGLDIRLFNSGVEWELDRMPFGVAIELLDLRGLDGVLAPPGAYCRISFYKPEIVPGSSGQENEIESMLPGAIYLTSEGVIIKGAGIHPSSPGRHFLDYRER
jgi:hypothetical protein